MISTTQFVFLLIAILALVVPAERVTLNGAVLQYYHLRSCEACIATNVDASSTVKGQWCSGSTLFYCGFEFPMRLLRSFISKPSFLMFTFCRN